MIPIRRRKSIARKQGDTEKPVPLSVSPCPRAGPAVPGLDRRRRFGRWAAIALALVSGACHNARIPARPGERGPARVLPVWEMVWSSFRYYLQPRTPDEAAADLDRVIRHYREKWGGDRVVLVGYSMGADVLPFLVNRLPPHTRSHVAAVALVALAGDAVFEFHPRQWWGRSPVTAYATRPEVARMAAALPVTCVWGRGDPLTACPGFADLPITVVGLGGGHHFKSNQHKLSRLVVDLARAAGDSAAADSAEAARR